MFFSGDVFRDFLPLDQIISLLCRQKSLNFTPGNEYLYSNSNYVVLAEIITRVTGTDFREYIHQHIFEPLGMKDTYFVGTSRGASALDASGYKMGKDNLTLIPYPESESPVVSTAQIVSTVKDIATWDRQFVQKLSAKDDLGLLMLTQGRLNAGDEIGYSVGFNIYPYKEQTAINHGGFSRGFQSNHTHFREAGFSVIVFSNSPKFNVYVYTDLVADIILKDLDMIPAPQPKSEAPTLDLTISKKESKPYLGSYFHPASKLVRVIYRDEGILRYNRPDRYSSRLAPMGNHTFRMIGNNNEYTSKVTFEFNEANTPTLIYHYPNSKRVMKCSRFEPPNYKTKDLYPFAGTYYSEELDCQFEFKVVDNNLVLYRGGRKVSSLKAFKKNTFRDNLLGIFEFEKDEKVTGFVLTQERAREVSFLRQ